MFHRCERRVELEAAAVLAGCGHRGHVAWYGVLSDAVLPTVADWEADWHVFHRVAGLGRRGWLGVGGIPADGWTGRPGRVQMDVPDLRAVWCAAGHLAALVATRPAAGAGRAKGEELVLKGSSAESRGAEGRGCRRALSRFEEGLSCQGVEHEGPVACAHRLAVMAPSADVLRGRRRWHWNTAVRKCHHRGH